MNVAAKTSCEVIERTRSFISPAALLVNVTAAIFEAGMPRERR